VQKFAKLSIIQPEIARLRSNFVTLDNTNFQGQQVKGQGHSVT